MKNCFIHHFSFDIYFYVHCTVYLHICDDVHTPALTLTSRKATRTRGFENDESARDPASPKYWAYLLAIWGWVSQKR